MSKEHIGNYKLVYNYDEFKLPKDKENITEEEWKYLVEELNMGTDIINEFLNIKNSRKYNKKYPNIKVNRGRAIKLGSLLKTGYENAFQADDFNQKREKTCLEKYGTKHHNQSQEVKEKYYETISKRTDKDREEIWEKKKATNQKRYGVDAYSQTDEYKEKSAETCIKKYGVEFTSQIEGRMDKVRETNLKNCGYESNLQDPEFIKKSQETKLERYGDAHFVNPEKAKQTKLKRYGDGNYNNKDKIIENWNNKTEEEIKDIVQKRKETKLEKYGDENFTNREKYVKTVQERYNCNNVFQSDDIKEKSKQTNLQKCGVEYYSQSNEFKELYNDKIFVENINDKKSETLFNNYGITNTFQLEEVKEKSKQTNLQNHGVEYYSQSNEFKKLFENQDWVNEINRKKTETMRKNGTFTGSKEEDIIYEQLIQLFPNTKRNYDSDIRYKHKCDYYIPELDLFIEYQGTWFHGKAPFDPTNIKHIKLLEKWKNKAQNENKDSIRTKPNSQYINAINCWTKTDVIKREEAKRNNLNFKEIWNMKDFNNFFEELKILKLNMV